MPPAVSDSHTTHAFSPLEILIAMLDNPTQLSILIVLVLLSLSSLGIGIDRFRSLRRMDLATLRFIPAFTEALRGEDADAAIQRAVGVTRSAEHRFSHLASVVIGGLLEYQKTGRRRPERRIAACERALERAAISTSNQLRRGLPVLATVASSAPFVGLLGTVFGVISSFQSMGVSGEGGLDSIASGIAEALFMTGVGLAVAIPAVWLYNYFASRIERLEGQMTNAASEMLDHLIDVSDRTGEQQAA